MKSGNKIIKKFLVVLLAAAVAIGLFAGLGSKSEEVYAAGNEVAYTNGTPHNQKVKEGNDEYQVYCISQGRPYATDHGSLSGKRYKYAWNDSPVAYNQVAEQGNALMGGNYTYALSWAILGGMYTSDGNPRTDLSEAFTPLDDMSKLAQILKNVFYYAETENYSSTDIQNAIYAIITGGDVSEKPKAWSESSLQYKAWNGGDIGKDKELYVYIPDPKEITKNNGLGYGVANFDQALVTTGEPAKISTTVSVEGKGSASADAPLTIQLGEGQTKLEGVTVIDTVTYENMPSGNYNIRMDIVDSSGNSVAGRDGNADLNKNGTIDTNQTTKWGVTLEPGTYAVNIKLTTADGTKTYEHKGLQDTAEQIVVKTSEGTTPTPTPEPETVDIKVTKQWTESDGTTLTTPPDGAEVVLKLYADGEFSDEKQKFTLKADAFTNGKCERTFTNLPKYQADGTTEIEYTIVEEIKSAEGFEDGGCTGDAANGFIYTNKKIPEDEPDEPEPTDEELVVEVTYDDGTFTNTLFTGEIGTTVKVGDEEAAEDKAVILTAEAAGQALTKDVTDTVHYKGMQPGDTYTVTGSLMKVKDASTGEVEQVGDSVTKTDCKANANGEGDWEITFTGVTLEPDTTYVVYEEAKNNDVNKAEDTAEHKDATDKSQTIIVKETTPKAVKQGHVIINKVDENNALLGGATFEIRQGDQVIKTITSDNNGDIAISGLQAGTYTLHETAAPEGYQVAEDKTFTVVGESYTIKSTYTNEEPHYGTSSLVAYKNGAQLPTTVVCVDPKLPSPGVWNAYNFMWDTEFAQSPNSSNLDAAKIAKIKRIVNAYENDLQTLKGKLACTHPQFEDAGLYQAVHAAIANTIQPGKYTGISNNNDVGNVADVYDYLYNTVANSTTEVVGHVGFLVQPEQRSQDVVVVHVYPTDVTMIDQPQSASEPTKIKIVGKKVLSGEGAPALKDGQFSFTLTGAPVEGSMNATNKADGSITFEEIELAEAGTYTFQIKETEGNDPQITYDAGPRNVVVTTTTDANGNVVVDKANTKMRDNTAVTFTEADGVTTIAIPDVQGKTFDNKYRKPEPTKIKIVGKKVLSGEGAPALKDGDFNFTLTGAPVEGSMNADNKADGSITFEEIELAEADKEYTFQIKENKGTDPQITYDAGTRNVVVKTTKDANGNVVVDETNTKMKDGNAVTFTKADGVTTITIPDIEGKTFKNTYVAPGKVQTTVQKKWHNADGEEMGWPEGKTVTFTVKYGDNEAETITLDADHTSKQTKQYTKVDGAQWTVEEVSDTVGFVKGAVEGDAENGFSVTNKKMEIATTATDNKDGDKEVKAEEKAEVKDVVKYTNLIPGKEYTMEGQLVKKSDESVVATASTTFTASESGNGEVVLVFEFDARDLAGESAVAFETCKEGEEVVATHNDINDEDQTVEIKKINVKISKVDATDATSELKGATLIIKDTDGNEVDRWVSGDKVHEVELKAGTYTLTEITAPEGYEVAETITFKVGADGLVDGEKVTMKDQPTPKEPEIATTATDNKDGDKEVKAEEKAEVKDVVKYTNLIPGKEYTMEGQLVKKSDESVVATASTTFTASESGNGEVVLVFEFDARDLAGESAVAFETCKEGEEVVATHNDINDEDQTVEIKKINVKISKVDATDATSELKGATLIIKDTDGNEVDRWVSGDKVHEVELKAGTYTLTEITAPEGYEVAETITFKVGADGLVDGEKVTMKDQPTPKEPEIATTATDNKDGDKEVKAEEKAEVKDVVKYTNLIPGKEYTMEGQLVKKSDESVVATASTTFTASESGNGEVVLVFEFDSRDLAGESAVAFETCKEGEEVVATHNNINDADQTVEIKKINAKISKVDATDATKELKGATLIIKDAEGNEVDRWVSTDKVHEVELKAGTYTLTEITAPKGYEVAETITFKVGKDGLVDGDKVTMKDQPTPKEPEIETTATDDADGDKLVKPAAEAKVKDTVVYTNLIAGKSYTMKGQLIKKSDKSVVAEAETTFTAAESGNGTVELIFTFDAGKLAGESAVAFEKCYEGEEVVAKHEDLNDADQTVEITKPEVEISKTDAATSKELPGATLIVKDAEGEEVITWVSTSTPKKIKLAPGEYTLTEITAPKGYEVAETINFTVNEDGLVGSEKVEMKDAPTPEEPGKPEIATTATDDADGDKLVKPAAEAKVKDTVVYTNLIAGKSYTMKGQLIKKSDKSVVAEAETTFTAAESGNGTVELIFTFDAGKLAGESAVAFEKCYEGEEVVAKHEDLNDADQTVEITKPEVEISKTDAATSKELPGATLIVKDAEGEEVITWVSTSTPKKIKLAPGEYTLTEITAPKGYEVAETINFTVNEDGLVGSEKVEMKDAPTPEEPGKPEIATTATDDADGDKLVKPAAEAKVKDTVVYTNLIAGKSYTMKGQLIKKSDKSVVAEAETTFTAAESGNGTVELIFTFDAGKLAGESAVAFEKCYEGEEVVAKHEDLNDADQTVEITKPEVEISKTDAATSKELPGATLIVKDAEGNEVITWVSTSTPRKIKLAPGEYTLTEVTAPKGYEVAETINFTVNEDGLVGSEKVEMKDAPTPEEPGKPEIATTATDDADGDKLVKPAAEAKVKDTVVYTNLIAGKSYTMKGQLIKKSDRSVVAEAETTFTAAESGNGTVELIFTFDAGKLAGESAVAFEKCYEGEEVVAKHEDLNDADQTVEITKPEVEISKTDAATSKELPGATLIVKDAEGNEVITWVSTSTPRKIKLAPGEYTLTEVTAPKGYEVAETINFTVNEDGLVGSEKVEMKDAPTPEEPGKPEIATTATDDADGDKLVKPAAEAKVKDTVVYTNLIAGKSYTMKGQLIKKSDKSVVAEAETTFTAAESGNGTVELIFTFDAGKLAGESAVAFEKCYEGEEVVAKHEDLNDADQTVEITKPEVEISKTAVADSAELPGAKLIITKKDSEDIVAQHTSTTQTWKVKLAPGEYTLTEITAPKGYEVAESIDFTVNEDGLVGSDKVHMEDAPTPDEPKPEITEVTVNKVWDDNNNQDGKRTENVTVNLLADGTAVAKYVLNSSNNWTHTFTALPKKNAEGKDFVYTVVETEVPAGYEAAVNGFTITNKHTPETVTITGTKTWNDADNQDGKRPASITVNLLANGTVKDSKTVTQKDNWTYTWKDLPKYENGSEIKYTVTENKVEGYQATSDGINIINNYTPGKTSVSVVKAWADENDKDAIRPENITVALTADGTVVETQVLNAANGWTHTWTDLDENKDGKTIEYAVDEIAVPEGYTKTVSENNGVFTVTNTHTPEEEKDENPWVTISKTDAATSAELPGATLVIKNNAGETVVTFVSGEEPTRFQLEPGEYTLTEITAPHGYAVAETISFTVNEEGLVGSDKVEMVDAPIEKKENPTVTISKTDAATSEELPGAELIIRNSEGKIVENFVSGSEPTLVQLAPGEYTLTELTAPKGYQVAETITFTVDENGLVGSDKVEMIDEPTKVTISKQAVGGGAELEGATLLVRNASGEVIEEWVSGGAAHEFTMLPVGEYTLTEISAPKGYKVAETIRFRIIENGTVECFNGTDWVDAAGVVVMYDAVADAENIKSDVPEIPEDDTPAPEPTVTEKEEEINTPETPEKKEEPKKDETPSEDKVENKVTPVTEKKEATPVVDKTEEKKPEVTQNPQTPQTITPVRTRRAGSTVASQTPAATTSVATNTGDSNNSAMWIAIAAGASAVLAAMAVVVVRRRRTDM